MGSKHNLLQDQKQEISLFEGDDGFCIRRILAREPSLNQSFDSFYRESEGIPFKWEIQPGTPKEYPQQDGLISTFPLSPSPLMQSLKLRPPDNDDIKGSMYTSSKMKSFKKMVQKRVAFNRDKVQKYGVWRGEYRPKESLRFGEFMKSVKDSSASTSSSSFSVSWKDRGLDSSRDSMFDPGSCCRNGDVAGIVLQDEENKGIALIPKEERQPGTTKHPRGNEVVQPPPAVHSSYLPPPRLHDGGEKYRDSAWTKKAWFWIKGSRERRKTKKFDQEISFRCPENMEICDHSVQEFHDSLCRYSSSVASESNANFETLTMKRASYFSCGSWKGMKRDSCVRSKQI